MPEPEIVAMNVKACEECEGTGRYRPPPIIVEQNLRNCPRCQGHRVIPVPVYAPEKQGE